jgi:hypothetical protein
MREGEAMETGDQSLHQASHYTPLASSRLWQCDVGRRLGGAAAQQSGGAAQAGDGHAALARGEAGKQLRSHAARRGSRETGTRRWQRLDWVTSTDFFGGEKQKERCGVYVGWLAGIGVLAHFGVKSLPICVFFLL